MYFAQNNSLDKFELYLSFLAEIQAGNDSYKKVFTPIFKEVKQLSLKEIDYTKVSSETFDIVSILAFNHAEFFKTINPEDLPLEDYKKIYKLLQEDVKHLA